MDKCITIVLDRSPFGTVWNIEGLRIASGIASLDMDVKLLFIDDGVFNAIKNQKPEAIMRSPVTQLIQLVKMISESAEVLVVRESLKERGLSEEDLDENYDPKIIPLEEVTQTISESFSTITV